MSARVYWPKSGDLVRRTDEDWGVGLVDTADDNAREARVKFPDAVVWLPFVKLSFVGVEAASR